MSLRFLAGLLLVTAALSAETPEQSVLNAEKAWGAAIVSGDMAVLGRVMSDDLTYGHASGATDTKQSYIDRIQSGAQKYVAFQYDPGTTVRIYGNTAVLNGAAQVHSVTDGKPNSPHLRFLHVYVKKNGEWRLVAHQSTRLPN